MLSSGTSLLSNFERVAREDDGLKELMDKYGLWGWYNIPPRSPLQARIESFIPVGNPVHDALYNFLKRDPRRVSAELNSFFSFIEGEGQDKDDVEVMIYTTNTANNRLSVQIMYEYMRDIGYYFTGEPVIVKGFGEGIEFFEDGLKNMLDRVVRIIYSKTLQGYDVYVNATAGFKPETTFMVIASLLSRRRPPTVYYMHESFKTPVEIPPISLDLDPKLIDMMRNFLTPVSENQAMEILSKYGRRDVELYRLVENGLLEEKNGLVKTREWLKLLIKLYHQQSGESSEI